MEPVSCVRESLSLALTHRFLSQLFAEFTLHAVVFFQMGYGFNLLCKD